MACINVGSTNPDIAGLGIILAFAIQGFISLVLSVWSSKLRDITERDPTNDVQISVIKRLCIDKNLLTASDAQTLMGIALLASALIQRGSLDLYHYHIVYDIVNFTAYSSCAAIPCTLAHEKERRVSRFVTIFIFTIFCLAFCIIFGQHLEQWNWDSPGACYNTRGISTPDASHPYVDRIYLGITSVYMFSVLLCSIVFYAEIKVDEVGEGILAPGKVRGFFTNLFIFYRFSILVVALVQYPLHLYSIFALRSANEYLLVRESENTWILAPIFALIMVGQTLVECYRSITKYQEEKEEVIRRRPRRV